MCSKHTDKRESSLICKRNRLSSCLSRPTWSKLVSSSRPLSQFRIRGHSNDCKFGQSLNSGIVVGWFRPRVRKPGRTSSPSQKLTQLSPMCRRSYSSNTRNPAQFFYRIANSSESMERSLMSNACKFDVKCSACTILGGIEEPWPSSSSLRNWWFLATSTRAGSRSVCFR